MERVKASLVWFRQTSTLVGIPIVFLLVIMGAQKFLFSALCYTAGMRCEYAIGATDSMVNYMGDLLASNPGMDLMASPRKK